VKKHSIIPLADNIVVERALPERFSNGILLPILQYDDKTVTGTVIAIGPNVHDVKPLDVITFPKYCNKEFIVDEQKVLIMREVEVFAVIG
jgi:co-chaperonin GroES (HSP10)